MKGPVSAFCFCPFKVTEEDANQRFHLSTGEVIHYRKTIKMESFFIRLLDKMRKLADGSPLIKLC